jgi:hypothetical protein
VLWVGTYLSPEKESFAAHPSYAQSKDIEAEPQVFFCKSRCAPDAHTPH